jgi:hypothetical protein
MMNYIIECIHDNVRESYLMVTECSPRGEVLVLFQRINHLSRSGQNTRILVICSARSTNAIADLHPRAKKKKNFPFSIL